MYFLYECYNCILCGSLSQHTLKIIAQLHLQISVYLGSNKLRSLRRVATQVTLLKSS